jgi:hypothetical protein
MRCEIGAIAQAQTRDRDLSYQPRYELPVVAQFEFHGRKVFIR